MKSERWREKITYEAQEAKNRQRMCYIPRGKNRPTPVLYPENVVKSMFCKFRFSVKSATMSLCHGSFSFPLGTLSCIFQLPQRKHHLSSLAILFYGIDLLYTTINLIWSEMHII